MRGDQGEPKAATDDVKKRGIDGRTRPLDLPPTVRVTATPSGMRNSAAAKEVSFRLHLMHPEITTV
ncbi:hypothetical protein [Streptomyces sp. NPDC127066]|uniref:hypothetical protein n=1 Tax=Streptomyces sp. NPDC127066 TaxID=3347125 RepID=UPI003668E43D